MKKSLLITLAVLLISVSVVQAEETANQEKTLSQIHQLENRSPKQQQAQKPKQQQTQQQAQKQGQQQTQQQAQKPNQQQTRQQTQAFVNVGPHWKIGTSWTVETVNLQKQSSLQKQTAPVVWVFTVVGETKIADRDCFEVAIRCNDKSDRQPRVSIWVDKYSGMLLRVTTLTLVKGQWRSFTETYSVPQGKSVAVLGSIPSLPLDMPVFAGDDKSKDLEGMTYEVLQGPKGSKDIDKTSFTYKINQSVKPVSKETRKELAGAKSLALPVNMDEAVEVELQGGSKNRVRQLWTPGTPWPVYSNNGNSESRLIQVTIPQQ